MQKNTWALKQAIDFHGHLGPYLVLGLLMGKIAVKRLACRKFFGVNALVRGASNKPKSCLIDGIQLSTGCTYGKGNIRKADAKRIEVIFGNSQKDKKVRVTLKENLIRKLDSLTGHKECELFARRLWKLNPETLFDIIIKRSS